MGKARWLGKALGWGIAQEGLSEEGKSTRGVPRSTWVPSSQPWSWGKPPLPKELGNAFSPEEELGKALSPWGLGSHRRTRRWNRLITRMHAGNCNAGFVRSQDRAGTFLLTTSAEDTDGTTVGGLAQRPASHLRRGGLSKPLFRLSLRRSQEAAQPGP